MKPKPKPTRIELGKRIYACLSACSSLEIAANAVLMRGADNEKAMKLLDDCRLKAIAARNDADVAMHEMGIGYHQLYET